MLRLLSLGAGVQSTTLLLMSLHGELEPLDGVIFADTGWEPRAVYAHLETLEARCRLANLPFHRVSAGHIKEDALAPDRRFASMPFHVLNVRGSAGMIRRQCTREYKIAPINRKVRELLGGNTRGKQVEQWLGISLDEAGRMRTSRVGYIRFSIRSWTSECDGTTANVGLSRMATPFPRKAPASAAPFMVTGNGDT